MLLTLVPFVASSALMSPLAFQESAPISVLKVSVVEDATGDPVIGARVLAIDEATAPVWGELWFTWEATTDSEGRAELSRRTESSDYDWVMVQADGYGTAGEMSSGSRDTIEFRLQPETPITIEVVDFLGRPLPLAHLGICFGCGHTPDLVTAVTGPDGRATLHGVTDYDGGIDDLYVVHPELSQPSYGSVPFDEMENGVARFHGEPGCVITGSILLPNGDPAVGHFVGNNETHRGHWARTDERGEFRLFGCEPQTDYLSVVTPGSDRKTFFEGARPGVYRTLQLDGTDQPEVFVDGQEGTKLPVSTLNVQIDVPNPEGLDLPERLRWIPVSVWNVESGMAMWDESDEDGSARFSLPRGDYRVEVGGANSPYAAREIGAVVITDQAAKDPIVVMCELPAPRVCSLEVLGLGENESVDLLTAAGHYTRYNLRGPDVRVPHFLLPSGRWSACTYRQDDDEIWRRKDLEVPRDIVRQVTIWVPE